MAGNVIEITIKALDKASKEFRGVNKELDKMQDKGQKSGENLRMMATQVGVLTTGITAFGLATKKAFEVAEEGAQLQLTINRFDRLAETIGTTGDVLRDELNKEIGGLLSNMESMELATDLMSLGLVNTQEEAVRMASAASQLNMDMNQLVLTLTNQTILRFDSLGVSIAGFDEKVEELSKTMSDEEAFTMAFLAQSEEQIEKVGSVTDEAAAEFKIFRARIKDSMDELKLGMANVITPAIAALNEQAEAQSAIDRAIASGLMTREEAARLSINRTTHQKDLNRALEVATQRLEEASEAGERNAQILDLGRERQLSFREATELSARRLAGMRNRAKEAAAALEEDLLPTFGATGNLDSFNEAIGITNRQLITLQGLSQGDFAEFGIARAVSTTTAQIAGGGGQKLSGIASGGGFASGGVLGSRGDMAVVGEEGYEYAIKRGNEWVIIPHQQSKNLARMGVVPGRGLYVGGPLGGGGGGPIPDDPYLPGSGGVKVPGGGLSAPIPPGPGFPTLGGGGGGGTSGSTSTSTQETQKAASQAATAAAATVGQQSVAASAEIASQSNQQFLGEFRQQMSQDRQEFVELLNKLNTRLDRLPTDISDSILAVSG